MSIAFDNSYARLPNEMYTRQAAQPVAAPQLIAVNDALAADLEIDLTGLDLAALFSGNVIPDGADPLAMLYAGHQFGHWNPQLGDGRALLLGEIVGRDGRRDIQLKGSGRTPYSRGGDGRSWLGPVLREYIVSEAMHAMGIPTTRALAAVTTGEDVYRETALPGAILTRVASSHIRIGTFQIFAARGQVDLLSALYEHARSRHYPNAKDPVEFFEAVMQSQADLIASWMGLGFIHGVMNTDNCSISGETIDYGPCAFQDAFHPDRVFSSIDHSGRYAYSNQPRIGVWNMAQLATSLIPLFPNQDDAVEVLTASVNRFSDLYDTAWLRVFSEKLGIIDPGPEDKKLIDDLLELMAQDGSDFTNTFANLSNPKAQDQFANRDAFYAWSTRWRNCRAADWSDRMERANPQIIPRNHRVEAVIQAGVEGDFAPFHEMLAAATKPFVANADYARPPRDVEIVSRTFCGT